MKKVLASMSKFIFGGFGIAVLALLMSLTYGALQKLFPGNFMNQMWGLVMFDIAAMCWAIAFVFQSKSTIQYAAAGLGFIVGFVGTLGMVAAEVMLSGQNLAEINTGEIGRWMVYGFITVTALHAALVYAHHAGAPEIHEQINVGIARGEIVTEAINQATRELDAEKNSLAVTITRDIVSQVKRDLGLYPVDGTPFEPRQYQQALPQPTEEAAWKAEAKALGMWNPNDPNDSPFERSNPELHRQIVADQLAQAAANQPGAPDDYGPLWKASTDITPTLDAYAWVCLHCDGHNRSYTRQCQWCQKPRTNESPVTAFADVPPIPKAEDQPDGENFPG